MKIRIVFFLKESKWPMVHGLHNKKYYDPSEHRPVGRFLFGGEGGGVLFKVRWTIGLLC